MDTEQFRKKWWRNVELWIYTIIATFIGGGASAVTAGFSAAVLDPEKFNINEGLYRTLKLMAICFLINGILQVFGVLKQSPLPKLPNEND